MDLFVLCEYYHPSSAYFNHTIAYVKGMAERGVHIKLFFLYPSSNRDKYISDIDNVDVFYLWEDIKSNNKYVKLFLPIKKFYSLMRPDIPVLVTGCPDAIVFLRLKRNIKLYHERTENPDRVHGKLGALYKRLLSKLDGIIVITPSLQSFFISEYGVKKDRIIVANMVVDESRFLSLERTDNSHSIGYCGTMSEWKDGISYLVKAFAIVHKSHPEYKLILMGKFDNEKTKDKIVSIINEYHIQDYVIFTGLIPISEMPRKLVNSEILALSRPRQKEKAFGFATKIGEYLMTERPVVMTDVGDVSYYLKDKENVILSKPNDEIDFAAKLNWVIEHPSEAIKIGKNGKIAAKNKFNYKIESEKVVDFIFGKSKLN